MMRDLVDGITSRQPAPHPLAEQVAIESSYRRVRTFQSRSRSLMSKRFGWCSR